MITLIGMGSGTPGSLTAQGLAALQGADRILGAKRLLATLPEGCTGNRQALYKPDEILACLAAHPDEEIALVYSGDTGFYSGASQLLPMLRAFGISCRVLPGLSSVQLLAAAVGRPWQDWTLVSAHGCACDPVSACMNHKTVFFLTGGAETPATLCAALTAAGLGDAYYPEKEYYATGMTKELDRCRWALETAHSGRTVALVCSGDAGVYGMASPLLELAEGCPDVTVEVVPGLTAALSGGAVLGAPLAHDFCVLSLSDRLTPWEVIEKRLAAAAMGDFCMAVYNPSSKGRPDYLARAVRILLQNGKAPDTVCGLVRNIGREGQSAQVLTLAQLEQTPVDMFTTVYIGNHNTRVLQGRMVTPRGYRV